MLRPGASGIFNVILAVYATKTATYIACSSFAVHQSLSLPGHQVIDPNCQLHVRERAMTSLASITDIKSLFDLLTWRYPGRYHYEGATVWCLNSCLSRLLELQQTKLPLDVDGLKAILIWSTTCEPNPKHYWTFFNQMLEWCWQILLQDCGFWFLLARQLGRTRRGQVNSTNVSQSESRGLRVNLWRALDWILVKSSCLTAVWVSVRTSRWGWSMLFPSIWSIALKPRKFKMADEARRRDNEDEEEIGLTSRCLMVFATVQVSS